MKIEKKITTSTVTTPSLSIFIENRDGVHIHVRNGDKWQGKQAECPLCENGSDFERALGRIGA